jgi:hypothetical protein
MTPSIGAGLAEHFGPVRDPRPHVCDHLLRDIIIIAICAVICGADDWVEVAEYSLSQPQR